MEAKSIWGIIFFAFVRYQYLAQLELTRQTLRYLVYKPCSG